MPTLRVDEGTLDYEDTGDGPPVLLLHSLGGSSAMWASLKDFLGKGFRLISFDSRSHGSSRSLPGFSVEQNALDAKAVLDDAGVASASVVGISMGGFTAQRFASKWPDKVRLLVLADTAAGGDQELVKRVDIARERISTLGFADFSKEYVNSRFMPGTAEDVRKHYLDSVRQMSPENYLNALTSIMTQDLRAALQSITAPTLVLVGDHDTSTPPAAARALADGIAGATLEVIAQANHFSSLDQPEVFNALVRSFLQKHEEDALLTDSG